GTSLTANGAWVEQLETALEAQFPGKCTLVNSGGAGKNSHWGLEQLERRVLQHKPDTVFIEFSMNDAVARFDITVEVARKNLEAMISRILEMNADCEVILMTMTTGNKYPEGHRSYRKDIEAHYEMYRTIAKERELLLIDHYPQWQALQAFKPKLFKQYVPDTIHAKDEGYSKVVTPVISETLGI
ncbi:SGNH/GDSL hydrolase family protein, partial [bacterium]|nr:SGNH/GDSL hydrolase family protein [bacterium]